MNKQPIRLAALIRSLVAACALVVGGLAFSSGAWASTSGNATIHNGVKLTYTSGTNTLTAGTSTDVTVSTLATAPTVAVSATTATTTAGTSVSYTYTVRSNANGSDSYALSPASTDSNVGAPTSLQDSPNSLTLWGGIIISTGTDGTGDYFTIPNGSETGLTAGTTTVEISSGKTYKVSSITAGSAASTDTSTGATTAETNTKVYLTATGSNSTSLATLAPAAGTQVGEYSTSTLSFNAGTPTTAGTDGTHTVNTTFTTTAKNASGAGGVVVTYTTSSTDSNETVTTVSSPSLTITKLSRNVTAGGSFAASGVSAMPGEVLEYQITVTNSSSSDATGVYIQDTIPDYTAIKTGVYNSGADDVEVATTVSGTTTTTDYTSSSGDTDNAALSGGVLTVTLGSGSGDANTTTGGTIAGGATPADKAVIIFQVTVQ